MKLRGRKGEFYFHRLESTGRLGHGDGRIPVVGVWMRAKRTCRIGAGVWSSVDVTNPRHCAPGMHACRFFEGLTEWGWPRQGTYLCVVKLKGRVQHHLGKAGKSVGRDRMIVAKRLVPYDLTLDAVAGLRSEDVARWIMNPKLSWPKRRK